jgi:hypothetical protein
LEGANGQSDRATNKNPNPQVRFEIDMRGAGWHNAEEVAPRGDPQYNWSLVEHKLDDVGCNFENKPKIPAPREDSTFDSDPGPQQSGRTMP